MKSGVVFFLCRQIEFPHTFLAEVALKAVHLICFREILLRLNWCPFTFAGFNSSRPSGFLTCLPMSSHLLCLGKFCFVLFLFFFFNLKHSEIQSSFCPGDCNYKHKLIIDHETFSCFSSMIAQWGLLNFASWLLAFFAVNELSHKGMLVLAWGTAAVWNSLWNICLKWDIVYGEV